MESSLSPDQFGLPELVLSAVMESMEEPVWTTWSRMKDWISASVSAQASTEFYSKFPTRTQNSVSGITGGSAIWMVTCMEIPFFSAFSA